MSKFDYEVETVDAAAAGRVQLDVVLHDDGSGYLEVEPEATGGELLRRLRRMLEVVEDVGHNQPSTLVRRLTWRADKHATGGD